MTARQQTTFGLVETERFWKHVDCSGDCWLWTGPRHSRTQYGFFRQGSRQELSSISTYAHRVSWELTRGPIPEGLCVLHKCDNPPCVNPEHLWVGTHTDNMRDMMSKGRHVAHPGEANGSAKLTPEQVRDIRRRYVPRKVSLRSLAEKYHVSESLVHALVTRRLWAHLD